jgi:hypothetical protein
MAERGTLERLLILAHLQPDYSAPPILSFEAYVNPAEVIVAYEMEYDSAQGAGTTGSRMDFKKLKPGDLSLSSSSTGPAPTGAAPACRPRWSCSSGSPATTA